MIPSIIQEYLTLSQPSQIKNFLSQYSIEDQKGLIACVYIGREHLGCTEIRKVDSTSAFTLNKSFINHIESNDYENILFDKFPASKNYLAKLIDCAQNSNFDLSSIFNS